MTGVMKVHTIIILLLKVLSRLSKNACSIPRMHDFLGVVTGKEGQFISEATV